jgi:protocatechuate 3,4-dioxygenase beta subunit
MDLHPDQGGTAVSRRGFIIAGVATAVLAACGSKSGGTSSDPSAAGATATSGATTASSSATTAATATTGAAAATSSTVATEGTTLTAADFDALGTCLLLPEKTAGPFPLEEQFVRRDVTEGYPGHPLRLGLRVLDGGCQPVPGAAVEIWHADATGDYSAFADGGGGKDEGPGTTFLRGTQVAGDDGIVEFLTIYPGWYSGRAVHIHLRVHVDDTTVLTSQLFFDEDHTASVYAGAPYAESGLPDTSNDADSIAGDAAAEGTLLHLTASETTSGTGTLGLLNLGIDPTAESR